MNENTRLELYMKNCRRCENHSGLLHALDLVEREKYTVVSSSRIKEEC